MAVHALLFVYDFTAFSRWDIATGVFVLVFWFPNSMQHHYDVQAPRKSSYSETEQYYRHK